MRILRNKRNARVICLLAVAPVLLMSGPTFGLAKKEPVCREISQDKYEIGPLFVDAEKREIHLTGRVMKREGWVQFLFYCHGYRWLEEESAIIVDADLIFLQTAIALLDWELWHGLWEKKVRDGDIKVKLNWRNGKSIPATQLLKDGDGVQFSELIFLGSPYFDEAVLGEAFSGSCSLCPLYALEEKALRKEFVRPSGKSGYFLDENLMPPNGTYLKITIGLGKEN